MVLFQKTGTWNDICRITALLVITDQPINVHDCQQG